MLLAILGYTSQTPAVYLAATDFDVAASTNKSDVTFCVQIFEVLLFLQKVYFWKNDCDNSECHVTCIWVSIAEPGV